MKRSFLLKTVTLPAKKSKELSIYTYVIDGKIRHYNKELINDYFGKYAPTNNQILDKVDQYKNVKLYNVRLVNIEDSSDNIEYKFRWVMGAILPEHTYQLKLLELEKIINETKILKWYEFGKKWKLLKNKNLLKNMQSSSKIEDFYNTHIREFWLDIYIDE